MIKSHDAPKKLRFADEIGERYGEIEYMDGKVLQPWCGSGDNWNFRITFAYVIWRWVSCFFLFYITYKVISWKYQTLLSPVQSQNYSASGYFWFLSRREARMRQLIHRTWRMYVGTSLVVDWQLLPIIVHSSRRPRTRKDRQRLGMFTTWRHWT